MKTPTPRKPKHERTAQELGWEVVNIYRPDPERVARGLLPLVLKGLAEELAEQETSPGSSGV